MNEVTQEILKEHREIIEALARGNTWEASMVAAQLLIAAQLERILREGVTNWPGEI